MSAILPTETTAVFFINQFLQHGRCWRLNSRVVTVTSTLEVTGFVADKRTSDNTTDVVAAVGQLFTGDFAQLVEFIQPKVSSWQAIWNTESAEV